MNILLTLSNKKSLSYQYSDVPNVSISNKYIMNYDKMAKNELRSSPQTKKGKEKENLLNKHLPNIKIEECNKESYIKSGFDSRIPPSQSMIYDKSGLCWLIAMLECFKSNEELRKYIFVNCKNDNFIKGLNNVLKIHRAEISEKDFELLMSIYTNEKPTRTNGSDSQVFLLNLIKFCSSHEALEETHNQESVPFFHIPSWLKASNIRFGYISEKKMPFIQIYIPRGFFKTIYLKVGDIFLPTRPPIPFSNNHSDSIILICKANFIILNFYHCVKYGTKGIDFKGIVIPKTLVITSLDNRKYKYSLTSIVYYEKKNNKNFNHQAAYIKRNNKWYDTDHEFYKYKSKVFHSVSSFNKLFFIAALDDMNKEAVIFDTAKNENNLFISLLFYEIEE